MAKDQQGLTLAGSSKSAEAFDRAVADYFGLTGNPVGILKQALGNDPSFVLGAVAIAGLFMIGGFRGDHREVTAALAAAEAAIRGVSSRERMHHAAVKAWAEGRSPEAALTWEAILADWPTDALALRFGQDAYLFLGRSLSIRDSAARVLPAWDRDNPLTSFVLGAYAFGLEETGELGAAEDAGREALARNPRDAWATHAIAHVMETAGRREEGIRFLKDTRPHWSSAHFMAGHNNWHLALFLIDEGRLKDVLADYDRFTVPKLADDMTLDRVDAASLLWRLELAGAHVGDRWRRVAEAWMAHVDDHVLAFNDLHCALAAARSPNKDDLGRFRRSLDAYERHGSGHNRLVTAEVGLRFIDGVVAYAAGDWGRAIDAILPVRFETDRIGGSHAQRDIINQTLIAAAERAGNRALVNTLLDERGRRPAELRTQGALGLIRKKRGARAFLAAVANASQSAVLDMDSSPVGSCFVRPSRLSFYA